MVLTFEVHIFLFIMPLFTPAKRSNLELSLLQRRRDAAVAGHCDQPPAGDAIHRGLARSSGGSTVQRSAGQAGEDDSASKLVRAARSQTGSHLVDCKNMAGHALACILRLSCAFEYIRADEPSRRYIKQRPRKHTRNIDPCWRAPWFDFDDLSSGARRSTSLRQYDGSTASVRCAHADAVLMKRARTYAILSRRTSPVQSSQITRTY